jgi:uncharacterized protein YaiL (DUF2058 family)
VGDDIVEDGSKSFATGVPSAITPMVSNALSAACGGAVMKLFLQSRRAVKAHKQNTPGYRKLNAIAKRRKCKAAKVNQLKGVWRRE